MIIMNNLNYNLNNNNNSNPMNLLNDILVDNELSSNIQSTKQIKSSVDLNSIKNNKLTEIFRRTTNNQLLCSMFCGGRRCKYENADVWPTKHRAIRSLYSHWITDNILAMSRPNMKMINRDNLIRSFHEKQIKTIINLQEPGEHANCGPPLIATSGFTYDPKIFMDNNIYFYNYKWKDFLDLNEESLMDIVKVLTFSLYQGRVAIHCHAGLGRTGTLIAAFLIYTFRFNVMEAINFVRSKRPNSIQSRRQIMILYRFAAYIAPCFIVFNKIQSNSSIKFMHNTLEEYLQRQNRLLHGQELRLLRYIPKIVFIICEKLLLLIQNNDQHQQNDRRIHRNSMEECYTNFTDNYLSNGKNFDMNNDNKHVKIGIRNVNKTVQRIQSDSLIPSRFEAKETLDEKRLIDALTDSLMTRKVRSDKQEIIINDESSNQLDTAKLLAEHRALMILDTDIFDNRSDSIEHKSSSSQIIDELIEQPKINDKELMRTLYEYQHEINDRSSGWNHLRNESDISILTSLLMIWFENFDIPIMNNRLIVKLNNYKKQITNHSAISDSNRQQQQLFLEYFYSIDICIRFTLEYLARFIIRLTAGKISENKRLIARFVASLSMKKIRFNQNNNNYNNNSRIEILPHNAKRVWPFMDDRSQILLDYFDELIQMIMIHDNRCVDDNLKLK